MNRNELISQIRKKKSFLCVGLDPDLSKMPAQFAQDAKGVESFLKQIIDATAAYCVAYKPNLAFFEQLGAEGWNILANLITYIGPNHLTIADAKRGDIGNTGKKYADAILTELGADAITVAPYMGQDSVTPFLLAEKWAIVLGLTSNQGSQDFQRLKVEGGQAFFLEVMQKAATWGTCENMMFVVGATHPEDFTAIRKILPDHFLLVPGVGAQGGDLAAVCRAGLTPDIGLLINSSRSILYASRSMGFAQGAASEARRLAEEMWREYERCFTE